MKAIYNAKMITEQGIVRQQAVIFSEKITALIPENALDHYPIDEKINANGQYLSPGFIDLHIHGAAGADVMDQDENALAIMSTQLPRAGVTAFLPTTMTMDFERIENALQRIRRGMNSKVGAEILGCYLEGPFISTVYCGAQDARYIVPVDFGKIAEYIDIIKIVTIAPELPGSAEFIAACAQQSVVAIGHSAATYEEAMTAIRMGVSQVTHMFNALAPFSHRQPGIVGALVDSDDITCELIADNIHVHPAAQRLLLRLKGADKLILVTDAMRASFMPDGQYDLGGQIVQVKQGSARLENGVIAGSVLTLDKAVANFKVTSDLEMSEVVKMVTMNPARKIGIEDHKGSISVGKDADLVLFDEAITVQATFIKGKCVYQKECLT